MAERIQKEREEVPEPEPVAMGGIRYESVLWGKARGLGQNGGYLAAVDEATGRELWLLKVYDVVYDEREHDKSDNFITEIARESTGILRVRDERGRSFRVDVERQVGV